MLEALDLLLRMGEAQDGATQAEQMAALKTMVLSIGEMLWPMMWINLMCFFGLALLAVVTVYKIEKVQRYLNRMNERMKRIENDTGGPHDETSESTDKDATR
ncbi:unnamed protein product, partial [marine sediment metagenome]